MLTTVNEYCKQRGVSRQYVYEYVRKGKFILHELPLFAHCEGQYIEVGTHKVLEIPLQYTSHYKFIKDDAAFIQVLTENPILEQYYCSILNEKNEDKRFELQKSFAHFAASLAQSDKAALENAKVIFNHNLLQHMQNISAELELILEGS
ncbi:MAG: hypothetical protein ACOYOA_16230 [Saprospiraceae bacterium]